MAEALLFMTGLLKESGLVVALHVTSAKTREGCDELREAIVQAISGHAWLLPLGPGVRTHEFAAGFVDGDLGTRWNAFHREDREHPLVRCGIALAGANRARQITNAVAEDGLLTGSEASLLHLQGTELVILSARDRVAGEVKVGEGVMPLRRAFRIVGGQASRVAGRNARRSCGSGARRTSRTPFLGRLHADGAVEPDRR